jgi:hypothetical protein
MIRPPMAVPLLLQQPFAFQIQKPVLPKLLVHEAG